LWTKKQTWGYNGIVDKIAGADTMTGQDSRIEQDRTGQDRTGQDRTAG
jgi:hypothetical protein